MRDFVIGAVIAISTAACAAPEIIEFPSLPGPPGDWYQFNTTTIPASDCPMIEGEYLEPPSVQRSGRIAKLLPKDNYWLFFGYIPLHNADREELNPGELNIVKNSFVIRQPDASQFYFSFLNHEATAISEYHFRSSEGDFECHDGYIEFPSYSTYGMIEGRSVNFQIRNVLLKDKEGALVIQSTRGPYRGNPGKAEKKFMFEFFRYPLEAE